MSRLLCLTAAVVVLSLGCSFVRAGDDLNTLKELEKIGATVLRDDKAPGTPIIALTVSFVKFGDADMKLVAGAEAFCRNFRSVRTGTSPTPA